jgi:hypothetical protein
LSQESPSEAPQKVTREITSLRYEDFEDLAIAVGQRLLGVVREAIGVGVELGATFSAEPDIRAHIVVAAGSTSISISVTMTSTPRFANAEIVESICAVVGQSIL